MPKFNEASIKAKTLVDITLRKRWYQRYACMRA